MLDNSWRESRSGLPEVVFHENAKCGFLHLLVIAKCFIVSLSCFICSGCYFCFISQTHCKFFPTCANSTDFLRTTWFLFLYLLMTNLLTSCFVLFFLFRVNYFRFYFSRRFDSCKIFSYNLTFCFIVSALNCPDCISVQMQRKIICS